MNRLLFCEPWLVSKLSCKLSINSWTESFQSVSLQISDRSVHFPVYFAASSPSAFAATFCFFGRGPTVGLLSLVRISVIRNTVISSRYPRLRREFLRRRFL